MNKQQFIETVASKLGSTIAEAAKSVNAVLDVIQSSLKAGEKIVLTGFGQFEARSRAARTGVNPATGKSIKIPACKVPAFKAGKGLKDAVNKK
ncbi:MAG: HU family DNA-binding protein [Clostridia bacterium]|nr:HU family DNA-binding protein [Clostridia bacterium]